MPPSRWRRCVPLFRRPICPGAQLLSGADWQKDGRQRGKQATRRTPPPAWRWAPARAVHGKASRDGETLGSMPCTTHKGQTVSAWAKGCFFVCFFKKMTRAFGPADEKPIKHEADQLLVRWARSVSRSMTDRRETSPPFMRRSMLPLYRVTVSARNGDLEVHTSSCPSHTGRAGQSCIQDWPEARPP